MDDFETVTRKIELNARNKIRIKPIIKRNLLKLLKLLKRPKELELNANASVFLYKGLTLKQCTVISTRRIANNMKQIAILDSRFNDITIIVRAAYYPLAVVFYFHADGAGVKGEGSKV